MATKYEVMTRKTPGAAPTVVASAATLRDARREAARYADRRDLCGQDVRIQRPDGSLVEYAGPAR